MVRNSEAVNAVRLHEHGKPLVAETVELPDPGADEVRVELEFGGVNPIDRYIAEGRVAADSPLPRTLGGEAAGSAGGRPVLVAGEGLGAARDGVWAQAAVVPSAAVVELPHGVGTREAAAMGIAGLTALNVVREVGKVGPGDRVLVLGASGGVGSMVVSLARVAGATVWGQTGSQDKVESIEAHGADRVLVGGPDELADQIAEFEPTVVTDPLGGAFVMPVLEAIAPRGRLVSYGVSAGPEVRMNMQTLYRKMVSLLGYGGMQLTREERRPGLESALEALRAGELKVRVDEVLALRDVNDAFQRLVERRVEGKLLLDLS
jgi:NADPH2:quinone reductase